MSTARQVVGFTPRREKIVLNEVKGFHEEKDYLKSSEKKTRSRSKENKREITKSPSRMLLEEL